MIRCAVGRFLLLVFPLIGVSGCVSLGQIPPLIEAPTKDPEKFAQCMAPLAAEIKPAFENLINNLQEPSGMPLLTPLSGLSAWLWENRWNVDSKIGDLFDQVVQLPSDIFVATDPSRMREAENLSNRINKEAEDIRKNTRNVEGKVMETAQRTAEYFKAYFTKSAKQPMTPSLVTPDHRQALGSVLANVLHQKPDNPIIGIALDKLTPEIQNILKSTSPRLTLEEAPGFVGREGTIYAFPGVVEGKGNSISVDHNQVGADAIRIIFESLRDSYAPLPVLANSTAAEWIQQHNHQCKDMSEDCKSIIKFTDKSEKEFTWNISPSGHISRFTGKISPKIFQDIDGKARNAEATTAGVVGKAIRGGSWGSLNNEAVAKFIETAAGVMARHTVERAEWCVLYSEKSP